MGSEGGVYRSPSTEHSGAKMPMRRSTQKDVLQRVAHGTALEWVQEPHVSMSPDPCSPAFRFVELQAFSNTGGVTAPHLSSQMAGTNAGMHGACFMAGPLCPACFTFLSLMLPSIASLQSSFQWTRRNTDGFIEILTPFSFLDSSLSLSLSDLLQLFCFSWDI